HTLRKARERAGIEADRPGGVGPWYWQLPTSTGTRDDTTMPSGSSGPLLTMQVVDNNIDKPHDQPHDQPHAIAPALSSGLTSGFDQQNQAHAPDDPRISVFTGKPYPPRFAKYRWDKD